VFRTMCGSHQAVVAFWMNKFGVCTLRYLWVSEFIALLVWQIGLSVEKALGSWVWMQTPSMC
jgi:hypothetical protein